MHARLSPARHAFRYPVYFFGFDLDELPLLNEWGLLAGYNRRGLVSVHDADHLDNARESIREKIMRRLQNAGLHEGIERILMVTSARFLGHLFNPVSFYYCTQRDGSVRCMLAEVNNTFGERHVYALPAGCTSGGAITAETQKVFHVSPFNDLRGDYAFSFSPPGEHLDIRIDLIKEGSPTMKTQLAGTSLPLTRENLLRTIAVQPFSALLTLPRIHWEAARLYFGKKLTFHPKPIPDSPATITTTKPALPDRLAMRAVLRLFGGVNQGRLAVTLPDRRERYFGNTSTPTATLDIRDYRFFRRLVAAGDVGLGESYTAGEWATDDLFGLIRCLIENWHIVDKDTRALRFGRAVGRIRHALHGNSLRGSRRNIAAHYDLGNEFFKLFLDETMMYSCALFRSEQETLADAQRNKIHRLLDLAQVTDKDHILEIGCGWGGFAIEAAQHIGCRVTAITISRQQWTLAQQRVRDAGLENRVHVELRDYRQIEGQFDKIVSVEMIEAVGHEHLRDFFAALDRALKPGGAAVLQGITIPHARYHDYLHSVDWIRKHIFPGGHLPSLEILREAAAHHSTLKMTFEDDIGIHYARTLREWREKFETARADIHAMGFDDVFFRKWIYYFALCEASFATRALGVHHLVFRRN